MCISVSEPPNQRVRLEVVFRSDMTVYADFKLQTKGELQLLWQFMAEGKEVRIKGGATAQKALQNIITRHTIFRYRRTQRRNRHIYEIIPACRSSEMQDLSQTPKIAHIRDPRSVSCVCFTPQNGFLAKRSLDGHRDGVA